ncbi:MAG: CidA/LrgA family protein [Erysipelotrichaceae bacterium]|nr:CidA/LrgA family protein [Erysipelotrichaceae bacterium]
MKIFKQLTLIIAFALFGVLVSYLLSLANINFPGSLIGMILLFIFLLFGLLKVDSIDQVSHFFIDNMGIFFVPGAILIFNKLELLSAIWWKLTIVILVAFIVSFTATYWSVKLTLYLQNKKKMKKEERIDA